VSDQFRGLTDDLLPRIGRQGPPAKLVIWWVGAAGAAAAAAGGRRRPPMGKWCDPG